MIELNNISKVFSDQYNKVDALTNISFKVKHGEFISIVGNSGSGKSTLLYIIGLLEKYSNGEYILNSKKINEYSSDELANIRSSTFGFVFQSYNLIPRYNVLYNILLPLQYSKKNTFDGDINEYLNQFGILDKKYSYPNQLSGGQQQRVAIARALINNPDIILADEPTGNLDSTRSIDIMNLFRDLNNKGKTIIMVTHNKEITSFSNKIIELQDGFIKI